MQRRKSRETGDEDDYRIGGGGRHSDAGDSLLDRVQEGEEDARSVRTVNTVGTIGSTARRWRERVAEVLVERSFWARELSRFWMRVS